MLYENTNGIFFEWSVFEGIEEKVVKRINGLLNRRSIKILTFEISKKVFFRKSFEWILYSKVEFANYSNNNFRL